MTDYSNLNLDEDLHATAQARCIVVAFLRRFLRVRFLDITTLVFAFDVFWSYA